MSNVAELQKKIGYDLTFDCVQCGYCLPVCPTYETMERETHSPRGRINLVKMVAEEKIGIEELQNPIEKCLGCMACTTVCPTDVQYGAILEGAKEVIEENTEKPRRTERLESFLFESFFPSKGWMNRLGEATWLYQASGLQRVAERLHLTKVAPTPLEQFEKVIPDLPSPKERRQRKKAYAADGPKKMTVAFFTGCIMDGLLWRTNEKTIELLKRSGAEVLVLDGQTCCGALQAHSGQIDTSVELAKQNIQAFEQGSIDYIVNNAGGCGARLVEYHKLFEEGSEWKERAHSFVRKVKDISEVLVELDGLQFTESVNEVVTYQPSCHMTNVQKVKEPPLNLLEKVPGITFKELERPDFCCGSAGVYNIVNYEESMEILDVKMKDVCARDPETIVTTNPGCLLQMKLGVERAGKKEDMSAAHLVDVLMRANPVPK